MQLPRALVRCSSLTAPSQRSPIRNHTYPSSARGRHTDTDTHTHTHTHTERERERERESKTRKQETKQPKSDIAGSAVYS